MRLGFIGIPGAACAGIVRSIPGATCAGIVRGVYDAYSAEDIAASQAQASTMRRTQTLSDHAQGDQADEGAMEILGQSTRHEDGFDSGQQGDPAMLSAWSEGILIPHYIRSPSFDLGSECQRARPPNYCRILHFPCAARYLPAHACSVAVFDKAYEAADSSA